MRGYLKLKKIDAQIGVDARVFVDDTPQKNKTYTLLVPVSLKSKEMTQVEAEDDDEDVYFNLEVVGDIRLLPEELSG